MKDLAVGLGIIASIAGAIFAISMVVSLAVIYPWFGLASVTLIVLLYAKFLGKLKREGRL